MPTAAKKPETEAENPQTEFVMVQPDRGQVVMFYPNCQTTPANRLMAYVMRVTRTNCELLVNGRVFEGVRHRDDPVLKTNAHARRFGCWEFTERDKKLDGLEERLNKLESLLTK